MANFNIDYLVVAGGGGGGSGFDGGGGGAGGLLTSIGVTPLSLTANINYAIEVGQGGLITSNSPGGNGGDSSINGSDITLISANGGGGGGGNTGGGSPGAAGGSGGGAGYGSSTTNFGTGTSGQGNNGGHGGLNPGNFAAGGGGGGASAVGGNATQTVSGNGGNGVTNSITVSSGVGPFYAGGGGGGRDTRSTSYPNNGGAGGDGGGGSADQNGGTGNDGINGTGGGGAGAGVPTNVTIQLGGNGGDGVVILRYATADVAGYTTTGAAPTEDTTTVAGQTILSFTTVGTGTINFTAPVIPTFDGTKVTTPVTGFQSAVDIGLKIPVGTNSNLPTGVEGMIRNDTDEVSGGTDSTTAITFYNGTDWKYFTSTESQDSPPIENFNTVLYDGNGGTKIINTVGFQPDLVWIKARDTAYNHRLFDSVRTLNSRIESNTTAAEVSSTQNDNFVSFDSNGFTLGATNSTNGSNFNGEPFVAWCFKAGGAAVTNNDGTITSQVSVNNNLGFSIVKYNSSTTAVTAGHGMDVTPEMLICKPLVSGAWAIYHKDMASDVDKNYIPFTTAAVTPNASSLWNHSNWGTTKIGSNNPLMFGSNNDVIAYCFASKPGFSKVGSYVGTGAGTSVTTGFEPAFVIIKKTSGSADWIIFNNKTGSNILKPNTNAAEVVLTNYITYDSTGFTFPTSDSNVNIGDFIYLAFAT